MHYCVSLLYLLLFHLRSVGQGTSFSICIQLFLYPFFICQLLGTSFAEVFSVFTDLFNFLFVILVLGLPIYWGYSQLRCQKYELIMYLECWRVVFFSFPCLWLYFSIPLLICTTRVVEILFYKSYPLWHQI